MILVKAVRQEKEFQTLKLVSNGVYDISTIISTYKEKQEQNKKYGKEGK